jgi:tetratricopeptide (TPR) repeat protein
MAMADTWHEVRSPNFIVVSDAGEGRARDIAWQFEQIRSAVRAGWPWARADLDRPFLVLAVKNESSMRPFAPVYWEERGRVRPTSVSAIGLDRHYVLLRTDVRTDGDEGVNPYQSAYWNYAQLLLSDSFEGRLPLWFGRGLSAVLSNTIVTNSDVQFGRVIPWYIDEMQRGRFSLTDVLQMTRESPVYTREVERRRFDAQIWALVHYLVFGDADMAASGARLNNLVRLSMSGVPPVTAVEEVFGSLQALDEAYRLYLERGLFRFVTMKVDAAFQKKDFAARQVPEAEALTLRAEYLVTTNRTAEARTAIDEAKALAPDLASAFAAEGRLFDRERAQPEALAAYERAVALGTDNFYPYVRLASLTPRQGATPESLARLRALLTRAIEINELSGQAHQLLGGVLLQMNLAEEAIVTLKRAAVLEPLQANLRLTLANALLRGGQRDEALTEARAALALARTDQQRSVAQSLIDRIGG